MNLDLNATLAVAGVLSNRKFPHFTNMIGHALRAGALVPLLPGTYAAESSFTTRVLSVRDWDPDAVFVGETAARLDWWPELKIETVRAATRRQAKRQVPGIALSRLSLPPELITQRRGLRLQPPAASCLELARTIGPSAIDEALRRRAVSLRQLHWALDLSPHRSGNNQLRQWLADSRDEPWSPLERQAHVALRAAGITGWKANLPIQLAGRLVYLDIGFRDERLGLEFDGYSYHNTLQSFDADRSRDVELQLHGWQILRFTAATLDTMPKAVMNMLRQLRGPRLGGKPRGKVTPVSDIGSLQRFKRESE